MNANSLEPKVIGPYRVVAGLGMGGMARVYLAMLQKPGFDKLFVIKTLRDELVMDPEFRSMFLNEARVAARLNHPNVVHTYEVGVEGDHLFIAMEYLEGQSLSAILSRVGRTRMPLPVHLRILCDVLNGLHYAHGLSDYDGMPLSIVHRDVSPQNVFVTYPGQVKVVDFGIAKVAGSAALTRDGAMKGKLGYMAPEQAQALPVDAGADIFAVGVMLWEALAACRFYRLDEGEAAVLRRRISGDELKVTDVNPDAPAELVAACEKAMALDRAKRFATAAEFRDALDGYLRRTGNADASEVAHLVEEAFAEDRAKLLRLIEEQVRGNSTTSQPLIMLTSPTPRDSVAPPRRVSGYTNGIAATLTAATAVPGKQAAKRARPLVTGIGIAASSVAVLALVAWPRATSTTTANAAAVDPPALVPPPAPPPPAPVSTSPAPVAEPASLPVVLTMDISPASARVTLDGAPVPPPFEVRRTADASGHRLEVTAPGYAPQTRYVVFDHDHRESVALAPLRAFGSFAARPPKAPAPSASATAPALPDVDLTKEARGRPTRPIDDQDPYK